MRALLVVLLASGSATLAAQSASPYVPLQHWAMPFVEHLISAGVMRDPTPLTRPFRQNVLLRALDQVDTTALSPRVRATIRRIQGEWASPTQGPQYRAEISANAAAATQAVRDPLEIDRGVPARRRDPRAFGGAGLDVELNFGSVVAVTHPVADSRLRYDPDWYALIDNATRFAEGYVAGQWGANEIFFGILDRNWGPSGVQGLLLSDNPYSMDHYAFSLGTSGIQLQVIATQLDSRTDSTGATVNRYLEENRLWVHPQSRWTLALWSAGITSGVGRQLEPWILNPASLTYFRAYGGNVNNFLGVDVERRGSATLFGQFMLDDIQVSRNGTADYKPVSYGLTVGAKGRIGGPCATWTVFYTQVANLTYRNEDDFQAALYHGLGLGRNFDDYDQATLKLSLLVRPNVLLQPEVTVLRQGQGDPRLPHPLVPQYMTTAVLFQGVVQRTVRLAVGGTWQAGSVSVTGDAGVLLLHNVNHVAGTSETKMEGSISVTYRFHHEAALP